MKINNERLHKFLNSKGITHFFHANALATSLTFIENNGLLSRGDVESNGLHQSKQYTDEIDKKYDVWDDVFLDTFDLHGFFPRQNLYGPVLFKIDNSFLLDDIFEIYITKDNPLYWNSNLLHEDKYFLSIDELEDTWDNYEHQKKMITIRKPKRPILFNYLEKIYIDDPNVLIYEGIHLRKESTFALINATEGDSDLRSKLEIHKCNNCFCMDNYLKENPKKLAFLFLPKSHEKYN